MTESLEKKKLKQEAPKRTNALYDSLTLKQKASKKTNGLYDSLARSGPIVGMGKMTAGSNISMKQGGAVAGAVLIGSISVAFFASFKSYHNALEKQESLNELFKNPNAKVAAGK